MVLQIIQGLFWARALHKQSPKLCSLLYTPPTPPGFRGNLRDSRIVRYLRFQARQGMSEETHPGAIILVPEVKIRIFKVNFDNGALGVFRW